MPSDDDERATLLRACMERTLKFLDGVQFQFETDEAGERALFARMMSQFQNRQLFSLEPLRVM